MYLRIVSARTSQGVQRYAQLVRSYRRKDGRTAKEVLGTLGMLSDQQIENLQLALKASRLGEAVVLPSEVRAEDWELDELANLSYLHVAVGLSMWRYWKLSELLNRLLPRGAEVVSTADIITPLVLQRYIDLGSKLKATRWFPESALPELLHVGVEHFNNTRIHRALEDLDRVDTDLQRELAKRYQQRDGTFASLFLDVTDTFFQGRGCEMAERDRTKEGLRNVRKIGIVLLCNQHGYPLRWQVVPGKRRDPQCMEHMVGLVENLEWARSVPFVCDRAMGHASAVARLVASGLLFLTSTRRTEIATYTEDLPSDAFAEISPIGNDLSLEFDIECAQKTAEEAGMEKVEDLLFVKDLGIRKRTLNIEHDPVLPTGNELDPAKYEGAAMFIALARIFRRRIESGEVKNQAALAKELNCERARVTQILNTLKLDEKTQERILRGDFGNVPERVVREAVKRRSPAAQLEVIERYAEKGLRGSKPRPYQRTGPQEVELRLVAYFNPQMFVEQRVRANEQRAKVDQFVRDLNQRLHKSATSPKPPKREDVYREVMNKLTGLNFVALYSVKVEPAEIDESQSALQVQLEIDKSEWRRRRRFDGFVLLIAHRELRLSASDLVLLYRAKDAVEKDFQTIKSVVKMRPIFHHTNPKVRAHVTLCMLALLVERTLEFRLRRSSTPMTASACFERLRTCHLNVHQAAPQAPVEYRLTRPTADQIAILQNLRLKDLLDGECVQSQLRPRSVETWREFQVIELRRSNGDDGAKPGASPSGGDHDADPDPDGVGAMGAADHERVTGDTGDTERVAGGTQADACGDPLDVDVERADGVDPALATALGCGEGSGERTSRDLADGAGVAFVDAASAASDLANAAGGASGAAGAPYAAGNALAGEIEGSSDGENLGEVGSGGNWEGSG